MIMKNKIFGLIVMLCLFFAMTSAVNAETSKGADNWKVTFTSDKKMESNFKTSDLDDVIYAMQPGDTAVLELAVKNGYSKKTDWYMKNAVLYSLEDRSKNSATEGGAYTYRLVYTDPSNNETVLFDSDDVGGDNAISNREGLKEATNALEDYFYLDTLKSGKSGKITLTVSLDGETQGNDYQDTLADLQMQFAVELPTTTTTENKKTINQVLNRTIVKTGDDSMPIPYLIAFGVSGLLLLFLAIFMFKKDKKKEKGGA